MSAAAKNIRLLTPHDLAFGIGRTATTEEWELYLTTCDNENDVKVHLKAGKEKNKIAS